MFDIDKPYRRSAETTEGMKSVCTLCNWKELLIFIICEKYFIQLTEFFLYNYHVYIERIIFFIVFEHYQYFY